jgi:hypothetical protein
MAGIRLLAADHLEALSDAQTWGDNPFVRRDARRDRKRWQPWRSFLWLCGTLLVLGAPAFWGLIQLQQTRYANAWFIGGDTGTALLILLCGIHIYFVVGASQKHTTRMLQEEISRTTLSSLLLLPATPYRIVLQSMVYPWLVGMRAALVLLPLYVFCVGLGGVMWLDIALLYLVFALSAVTVPRWNRPALDETVAVSTPTAEPTAFAIQPANGANASINANANRNSSFGSWLALSCFLMLWLFIMSRGNVSSAHQLAAHYAPDTILELVPCSFLSWPLLLARGLVTPFHWFAYQVPPLLFVLPLVLCNRYMQIVRVSEWLQVGRYRDLAILPTYLPRRRLEGALMIAQAFVWTGYLWRWGVTDGWLMGLAGWTGPSDAPGLLAFAYAILFVTLYWRGLTRVGALATWSRPAARKVQLRAVPRLTWRTSLVYLGQPLVFAALFYPTCCLMAHVVPFPHGVLPLVGRMLAVGLACWLMRFGLTYFFRSLLLVGAAIPFSMQFLALNGNAYQLPPNLKLLTYLSPFMGLVNLGSGNLGIDLRAALHGGFPWQGWVAYNGVLGLALTLLAGVVTLRQRRRAAATLAATEATVTLEQGKLDALDMRRSDEVIALDPTRVGQEVFQDATVAQATKQARTDAPLAAALIRTLQRVYDNAVMTKELRARLRGKLQASALQRTFLIFLVLTLALIYGAPQMAIGFGQSMAQNLFTSTGRPDAALCTLTLWYLALCATVPFVGAGVLPAAFAIDNEKSTLGFTLTTPMSSFAIVVGKAIGLLLSGCMFQIQLACWTLALSVLVGAQTAPAQALLVWGTVVSTAFGVTIMIGLIALAIASLFPRRLNVKAGSVIQGLMVYALFFAPTAFHYLHDQLVAWTGLDGMALWLAAVVGCCSISAVALAVATYGVQRMRKNDVLFSATKRDN